MFSLQSLRSIEQEAQKVTAKFDSKLGRKSSGFCRFFSVLHQSGKSALYKL
jgi:hypothetical protein